MCQVAVSDLCPGWIQESRQEPKAEPWNHLALHHWRTLSHNITSPQLLKQPCSNCENMNFISIKPVLIVNHLHKRLTLPHYLWLIILVLYTICLHLATLQFYWFDLYFRALSIANRVATAPSEAWQQSPAASLETQKRIQKTFSLKVMLWILTGEREKNIKAQGRRDGRDDRDANEWNGNKKEPWKRSESELFISQIKGHAGWWGHPLQKGLHFPWGARKCFITTLTWGNPLKRHVGRDPALFESRERGLIPPGWTYIKWELTPCGNPRNIMGSQPPRPSSGSRKC